MKNIHLLPTKSKTRLFLSDYGKILNLASYPETFYTTGQNIYITSDEKIKEGDWYINTFVSEREQKPQTHTEKRHLINHQKDYRFKYCKKIILTTDQDLIGVQAIDDESLEWFVKNPSCEEIEVESNYRVKSGTIKEHNEGKAGYEYYDYKIIIPKEEPKQSTKDRILSETPELVKQKVRETANKLVEPKQETLEEVAERYAEEYKWEEQDPWYDFMEGAKWQQEQIGKSEFLQKLRATLSDAEARRLIFETFKNK
jgi:hypothetical protein